MVPQRKIGILSLEDEWILVTRVMVPHREMRVSGLKTYGLPSAGPIFYSSGSFLAWPSEPLHTILTLSFPETKSNNFRTPPRFLPPGVPGAVCLRLGHLQNSQIISHLLTFLPSGLLGHIPALPGLTLNIEPRGKDGERWFLDMWPCSL